MSTRLDIFAIGEPMMEFNEGLPSKERRYLQGFGGDTSNVVIAAARQGAKAGYFTVLGDDPFGRDFLDLLSAEAVDHSTVTIRQGARTGVYFVSHGAEGHRFSYYRAGSAASLMTPDDIPADAIAGAGIVHVSAISQAISTSACDAVFQAIGLARGAGARVSYDTNLRLSLWPLERARAIIHASIALCDIALPGLDDARLLTGLESPDDICDYYLRLGCPIVALTLGSGGSLIALPEARRHVPGFPVEAVDATGAGDAFDGAFLAQWLKTGDAFAAGLYANAAAALSTTGFGAVAPLPRRDQVEAFMAAAPRAQS